MKTKSLNLVEKRKIDNPKISLNSNPINIREKKKLTFTSNEIPSNKSEVGDSTKDRLSFTYSSNTDKNVDRNKTRKSLNKSNKEKIDLNKIVKLYINDKSNSRGKLDVILNRSKSKLKNNENDNSHRINNENTLPYISSSRYETLNSDTNEDVNKHSVINIINKQDNNDNKNVYNIINNLTNTSSEIGYNLNIKEINFKYILPGNKKGEDNQTSEINEVIINKSKETKIKDSDDVQKVLKQSSLKNRLNDIKNSLNFKKKSSASLININDDLNLNDFTFFKKQSEESLNSQHKSHGVNTMNLESDCNKKKFEVINNQEEEDSEENKSKKTAIVTLELDKNEYIDSSRFFNNTKDSSLKINDKRFSMIDTKNKNFLIDKDNTASKMLIKRSNSYVESDTKFTNVIKQLSDNSLSNSNLLEHKASCTTFVSENYKISDILENKSKKDLMMEKLINRTYKYIDKKINNFKIINKDNKIKENNLRFWKDAFKNKYRNDFIDDDIIISENKKTFKSNEELNIKSNLINNSVHLAYIDRHFDLYREIVYLVYSRNSMVKDISSLDRVTLLDNFKRRNINLTKFHRVLTIRDTNRSSRFINFIRTEFLGIENNEYINRNVVKDHPTDRQEEANFLHDESDSSIDSQEKEKKKIEDINMDNNILEYLRNYKSRNTMVDRRFNNNSSEELIKKARDKTINTKYVTIKSYKFKKNTTKKIEENIENCGLMKSKNFSTFLGTRTKIINPIKMNSTSNNSHHYLKVKRNYNLTMSKENTMSKTLEIKTSMLKSRESPLEQLFFYIKDGNFIRFKNIFDRNKFLIESIDEHKNTLLNIAVQCSNYEISKYLLINGAKVNTQNIYLNSPLHYALSFKNYNIANLLISKKADEELKNSYGFTPWQCIAISQHV